MSLDLFVERSNVNYSDLNLFTIIYGHNTKQKTVHHQSTCLRQHNLKNRHFQQ